MKKMLVGLLVVIALTFGFVQPASAAPSLAQRKKVASQTWKSCISPYQTIWNTKGVRTDIKDAAFNVGFYTCSVRVFNYTSKYPDMFTTTRSMYDQQHRYRAKMTASITKLGVKLHQELHKRALTRLAYKDWKALVTAAPRR